MAKAKILLIDDDPDFVAANKMVLEESSYQVITAGQGDEGLKKARQEKPDLILLDVIMPVKDGFTAAEQLKSDPQLARIPVVMLTAYSTKGQGTGVAVGRGMRLEAEDYLEKPVSPEQLLAAVKQHLRK
jgi:two-component system alkaline phosphatase synthesis response regulator PhoP